MLSRLTSLKPIVRSQIRRGFSSLALHKGALSLSVHSSLVSKNDSRLSPSTKPLRNIFPASVNKRSLASKSYAHKTEKPFDKVLIANRGEIACRVMKTCKRLGIKTVAVYSEADSRALHVRMADEAYCIGPAASLHSYLNIPNIIKVIKDTGAQAVHPGYGFLSENSLFTEAVAEAGAVFLGPEGPAMEAMGDKIASKKLAIDAGVNVVPGYNGIIKDADEAVKIAKDIGYPVMIKASAGGGGKGMRVSYSDEETRDGFFLSTEEAKSSFNDDRIFIEKFIEDPHHIEIQLVADTHDNVVCFPERECSIQRRNQKVLEESPSCLLTPETRKEMQRQAALLARAVNYRSAGTVEFLADANQNFYFLEMNTRLQVEHPVTEYVSGEDLVEHMLWVGAGEALPKDLVENGVPINGWATEARVYAEDPIRGFLPSTGPLESYEEPSVTDEEDMIEDPTWGTTPCVRVDTGIFEGGEISMFYDPMICKLITYGKTRQESIDRLNKSLDAYVIRGPGHNLSFLRDLCRHPKYLSGNITTNFIPEEYPEGFKGVQLTPYETNQAIGSMIMMNLIKLNQMNSISGKWDSYDSPLYNDMYVCIGKATKTVSPLVFKASFLDTEDDDQDNGDILMIEDMQTGESSSITIQGVDWRIGKHICKAVIDQEEITLQYLEPIPQGAKLFYHGAYLDMKLYSPEEFEMLKYMIPAEEIDTSKYLMCPMPGQLISLSVEEGDEVEDGQELAVVEAMKMQNILRSSKKATIGKIKAAAGKSLKVDEIILEYA